MPKYCSHLSCGSVHITAACTVRSAFTFKVSDSEFLNVFSLSVCTCVAAAEGDTPRHDMNGSQGNGGTERSNGTQQNDGVKRSHETKEINVTTNADRHCNGLQHDEADTTSSTPSISDGSNGHVSSDAPAFGNSHIDSNGHNNDSTHCRLTTAARCITEQSTENDLEATHSTATSSDDKSEAHASTHSKRKKKKKKKDSAAGKEHVTTTCSSPTQVVSVLALASIMTTGGLLCLPCPQGIRNNAFSHNTRAQRCPFCFIYNCMQRNWGRDFA